MVPFNKQIPETVSSWLLAGLFSDSTGWNARLASQRLAGLESRPTLWNGSPVHLSVGVWRPF
jgi:hypothetical protein